MIIRYGPPSKMDTAPLHTLCKVANNSNVIDIYVQLSNNEEDPNWIHYAQYATNVSDEHIIQDITPKLLSKQ